MACLFNNHLIIQYDDTSDKPILIRRCCWSSGVARLSLKEFLKIKDIIEYRIIQYSKDIIGDTNEIIINAVDHLDQFKKFILESLGHSDIIKEELSEVCK